MEDEVIIIAVKPKMCDAHNEPEPDTWSFRCKYEKDLYEVNQPITRRPEYLAIRDLDDIFIRLVFRIDQVKSKFEKGQIVPLGKPIIKVSIPLKMKKGSLPNHAIWYTSFKTLLTHNSTDEFTEEKSPIITRVIAEDEQILCNGYYCIHFRYCKFFNHSPSVTIRTKASKTATNE